MRLRWRGLACLCLCGVLVWFLADAGDVRADTKDALVLCARSVIPSLFPFLVISSLLLSLGFGQLTAPWLAGLMEPLFRVPGAGSAEDFAARCLNCNLCVNACPTKILRRAEDGVPFVHLDYADGFCDYDCHQCSAVCPSGAIRKIGLPEKRKTQIGVAAIDESLCIKCGLCVMKCPRQVIKKERKSFPQIDAEACIGCGACQNACPVQAVTVVAAGVQKLVE